MGELLSWLLLRLGPVLSRIRIWGLNKIIEIQDPRRDPYIDREDEPFSYFTSPVMQLGVRDGRVATELTPEGHLYTGAAEIIFLGDGEPLENRIWVMKNGCIPLVSTRIKRGDVEYRVEVFHYWLDRKERSLVNMARISATNHGSAREVKLGVGFCYRGARDHRVRELLQEKFDKKWVYGFTGNCAIRGDKVIYCCETPPTKRYCVRGVPYNGLFYSNRHMRIKKDTLVCISERSFFLNKGKTAYFVVKIPHYPVSMDSGLFHKLEEKKWQNMVRAFEKEWKSYFDGTMWLSLPEKKAMDTFHSSRVFAIMAQNVENDMIIQHVNRFQYNAFWIRDSSFFAKFYLMLGHFDFARGVLLKLLRTQMPSGVFLSQRGQYDAWGQVLWTYGEYIKFTRDKKFAERYYTKVKRAIDWFLRVTSKDPYGLMPATDAFDNEMITGHYTGHNFWAINGLTAAIRIASFIGRNDDAQLFATIRRKFLSRFLTHLKRAAEKAGGRIPPGIDALYGYDWGNLLSVYPCKILDITDPLVINTVEHAWRNFNEGIATYGVSLHHYLTERVAQTFLLMGDQKRALEAFYGMLLHTGSCNEGFEWCIRPWGGRDYELWLHGQVVFGNYPPHGWSGVLYSTLLRNMLLRENEEDGELVLFSALSPAWIAPSSEIQVLNAATVYGKVNVSLAFPSRNTFILKLNPEWSNPPKRITWKLPWYLEGVKLKTPGNEEEIENNTITIRPNMQKFDIHVRWRSVPRLSYREWVRQFVQKWRKYQLQYYRKK